MPAKWSATDEWVVELAHELRQPLSEIESIAYFLEMSAPAGDGQAKQLLTKIQDLVAQANGMLCRAVRETKEGARAEA